MPWFNVLPHCVWPNLYGIWSYPTTPQNDTHIMYYIKVSYLYVSLPICLYVQLKVKPNKTNTHKVWYILPWVYIQNFKRNYYSIFGSHLSWVSSGGWVEGVDFSTILNVLMCWFGKKIPTHFLINRCKGKLSVCMCGLSKGEKSVEKREEERERKMNREE